MRIESSLENVETIPALWDYIEGDFLNLFFTPTDELGSPRVRAGEEGDKWGNWGRVLNYNQMQGVVRFEQSREKLDQFGLEYTGQWSRILQVLNATNDGFVSQNEQSPIVDPETLQLPPLPQGGRRLEQYSKETSKNSATRTQKDTNPPASRDDRRLRALTGPMTSSLPKRSKGDRFRFFLYPHENVAIQQERLKWFRNKQWLDTTTDFMDIQLYLLNCELGRPRLVEIKIQFAFSRGGGIFYKLSFETMMLKMFPGMTSMLADFVWFCLLMLTSYTFSKDMWKSFVKGNFLGHAGRLTVAWEGFLLMAGWGCMYGFYLQTNLVRELVSTLEDLRASSWRATEAKYLADSFELYKVASNVSYQLGYIRFLMAQYLLFLMFRFLVGFAVQPRLATVVHTLKGVLPDLLHFLIVAIPIFVAYSVSGNLIFGRRMEVFATLPASFSTCFRIIMECEYDWDTLSFEYYWTTAIWVWSYIILMNLILLNMVLAIILDIYSDVRQDSRNGEMAWTTVYNYWLRLRQMQLWVPDAVLADRLELDITSPMVGRDEFKNYFPDMPEMQLDLMYKTCAVDMGWESNKHLNTATALKTAGSTKMKTDQTNLLVESLIVEDDPLTSFMTATPQSRQQAPVRLAGEGNFLNCPATLKGGGNPHVTDPTYLPAKLPGVTDESPIWLKNLSVCMTRQKKWILYINWQLQSVQWQIQQSHFRKIGMVGAATTKVERAI